MMAAVDTPDHWETDVRPDPKWTTVLRHTSDTNPEWIARSPGGDTLTVARDLDTDTYTVAYDSPAAVEVDPGAVRVETKERAVEVTQCLVDSIVHGGVEAVESAFREAAASDGVTAPDREGDGADCGPVGRGRETE